MEEPIRLKRQLGVIHAVSFICGLVIGSGIWISPSVIMQYTNSVGASLLIWGSWGVISAGMGLVYVELGMMFQQSGGKYVYFQEAFGPFVAFLFIWGYLVVLRPGANALKLLIFAVYILKPFFPDCDVPQEAIIMLAIITGVLLTFVNVVDVKLSARGQNVFTSVTFIALGMVGVIGIIWICRGQTGNFKDSFKDTSTNAPDIILAFITCFYGYGGLDVVNFVIEEVKEPTKNLPRAIVVSMFCITTLYVMANVGFCAVLGREGIFHSQAVAASFALATFGGASWLMSVFIGINTAGSYNSGTLIGSRLLFVMARNGLLPSILNLVHVKFLSPVFSLIFLTILAIVYSLFDLKLLLANFTIVGIIGDVLAMASLIRLRYTRPDINRPYKVPIFIPWCLLLLLGFIALMPIITKPKATAIGVGLIVSTGIPYYFVFVIWRPQVKMFQNGYDLFLRVCQKVLMCTNEDRIIF